MLFSTKNGNSITLNSLGPADNLTTQMDLESTFVFTSELCHSNKYGWVTSFPSKETEQLTKWKLHNPIKSLNLLISWNPITQMALKPTFTFASVLCHNSEYGWVTSFASKERDQRRLSSSADPFRPFIPLACLACAYWRVRQIKIDHLYSTLY